MCKSFPSLFAGLLFVAAAVSARAAADDTFPGVPLPASTVFGSLNYDTDYDDVYSVYLSAGQKIVAAITGPMETEFDLYLYPPGSTKFTDEYVTYAEGINYPNRLVYVVPTGKSGTYYLNAYCYIGSGAYAINYKILAASANDTIPGMAIPASPFTDSLNDTSDIDDVFKINLTAGQVLYVTMTGASGTIFDVFLFGPTATDIFWDNTVALDYGDGYPIRLQFTVPSGGSGTYYLDTYCAYGIGSYTITYKVVTGGSDDVFPGVTPGASPISTSLGVDTDYQDIFAFTLKAGQNINASLIGANGTDFDLRLFAPGATNTEVDTPVAKSLGTKYPEEVRYTVPNGKAGKYYLVARAYSGTGTYTLTYKTWMNAVRDWSLYE